VGEAAADTKVRQFLKSVPAMLVNMLPKSDPAMLVNMFLKSGLPFLINMPQVCSILAGKYLL